MKRRRSALVLAAGAGVVLLTTPAVAATVTYSIPDSGLTKGQKTYYTTAHYVNVSGGDVEVDKTDGPAISISWYLCGQPGTGGTWKSFPNADPTGYIVLGTNFVNGAKYCLAAWDTGGSNATDTWRGSGKS